MTQDTGSGSGTSRVTTLEERIRLSEQALNLARADAEVAKQFDDLERIRIEAYRDILELQFSLTNAPGG